LNKRTVFGPIYGPLVRARHSRPVRIAGAVPFLASQHLRARRNVPYFAVDIQGLMGMGAVLAHSLRLCRYSEEHGLRPVITSTNPLYSTGPGADFLSVHLGSEEETPLLHPLRLRHKESLFLFSIPDHVPLDDASRLLQTFFPPKAGIVKRVDAVLGRTASPKFDLSMHLRGTDKVLEARPFDFRRLEEEVARHVSSGGHLEQVFLATDVPALERAVRERWPDTHFTTFNLGGPRPAGEARHFSDMPPADKAVEALVNIFLLARAPMCIRTSSYLSAMSRIANPDLRTVTLNRTLQGSRHFPEHEILAEEAARHDG